MADLESGGNFTHGKEGEEVERFAGADRISSYKFA